MTTAQNTIRKQLLELADRLGIDDQEAGESEWAACLSDRQLADAIVRTEASLTNYQTGEFIRTATAEELVASIEAAEHDGGSGVILVDIDGEQVSCYVVE